MTRVAVKGVGMTRFWKTSQSEQQLFVEAAMEALRDAKVDVKDIDAVVISNAVGGALSGQTLIRGEVYAKHAGLSGRPIINTENACASGATALQIADMAIRSGTYQRILVVGVESLSPYERAAVSRAMAGGVEAALLPELHSRYGHDALFMHLYAEQARTYMAETGATPRDFSLVSAKNSEFGSLNELAQYTSVVTPDEVLESRVIHDFLTLPMCAPISDGAAAVVLEASQSPEVEVLGIAIATGADGARPAAERAAQRAYETAGVGPSDLDVIEVHDATAPAELIAYEQLGICRTGGSVDLIRSGATRLGGTLPVNPSGGLLRKGHPLGATGVAQIVELTRQLRGLCGARQVSNARTALAHNAGGYWVNDSAVCGITILQNAS